MRNCLRTFIGLVLLAAIQTAKAQNQLDTSDAVVEIKISKDASSEDPVPVAEAPKATPAKSAKSKQAKKGKSPSYSALRGIRPTAGDILARNTPLTSRGGFIRSKPLIMNSTAYDASAGQITKMGTRVCRGTVAVDPRVIPLGSRLYIEGYGEALACDTGGAIKGNIIDVWFPTRGEALRWGRRRVTVWIIGKAN